MPYGNSCKNVFLTFPLFLIFSPLFYPSHLLFTVTDHSPFEILLAFLFFYSLSASEHPGPESQKAKAVWQVGKCFLCKYINLHLNVFICIQILSFIGIKGFYPCAPFVQIKIGFIKLLRKVGERSGLLPFSLWYYVYNLIIYVWEEPKFNFNTVDF